MEEIKTVEDFKLRAYEVFGNDVTPSKGMDALNYLYSLDWKIPSGIAFPESEITLLNLSFDTRGCFGRAVKAAVLAESLFPDEEIYCGEVREDLLRKILMDGVSEEEWSDETYIEEILQYESPHMIIVFGQGLDHFDPIFNQLSPTPKDFYHPSVTLHKLWEGLYSSYLISLALYKDSTESPESALQVLERAKSICSENILVKENMLGIYLKLGNLDMFIEIAKELVGLRKDAKTLMVLYLVTEDDSFKNRIIDDYSLQMFEYLQKTLPV